LCSSRKRREVSMVGRKHPVKPRPLRDDRSGFSDRNRRQLAIFRDPCGPGARGIFVFSSGYRSNAIAAAVGGVLVWAALGFRCWNPALTVRPGEWLGAADG